MSNLQTIEMRHPVNGELVNVLVVGRVYDDNGRYIGQKLRFPDDPNPKEMTFSQIYRLQGTDAVV